MLCVFSSFKKPTYVTCPLHHLLHLRPIGLCTMHQTVNSYQDAITAHSRHTSFDIFKHFDFKLRRISLFFTRKPQQPNFAITCRFLAPNSLTFFLKHKVQYLFTRIPGTIFYKDSGAMCEFISISLLDQQWLEKTDGITVSCSHMKSEPL